MTDIYHYWASDLQLSATGDLLAVDGVTETNQRILRGLMTAAPEYVFHATYGAAIGKHVGDALSIGDYSKIKADIRAIVIRDPNVSTNPAPTLDFKASALGYLSVSITYTYKPTSQLQTLSFNVGK